MWTASIALIYGLGTAPKETDYTKDGWTTPLMKESWSTNPLDYMDEIASHYN